MRESGESQDRTEGAHYEVRYRLRETTSQTGVSLGNPNGVIPYYDLSVAEKVYHLLRNSNSDLFRELKPVPSSVELFKICIEKIRMMP